jgi:hypothetical protein
VLPSEILVSRIRAEYREMPGLHLTLEQACRLLNATECEAVLETLVAEGFLVRAHNGAFIALPTTSKRLKAAIAPSRVRRGA